jgi:hypothetical protein
MLRPLRRELTRLLVCFGFCIAASGQSNTGSLSGQITDSSGAAVSGARVVLSNPTTGATQETSANDEGYYTFPTVPVGGFTVSAEKQGFNRVVQNNVNIAIASRLTVNLVLPVGDLKQTVEVNAQPPLLATESSDTGTNFQPKFMKDAPLFVNGGFRNPETFISYMPGVNNGEQESSINGGVRRGKEILIDGASQTNPESGGVAFVANGAIGSVEMYGEFKLLTSNFSAEYGRSGGGVEIFVTKSGTNSLHGTVFDFLRNDKFDAAGWTVNQRRPYLGKSKVRQNEYGVAVGGPVYIPKIYDGRNRTFWYFTWNGYRQNNGGGTEIDSVATQLMKQGNFSEIGKAIYDPATTATVNGLSTRMPFAGNIIPTSRFSTVSQKVLGYVPDPTSPGISNNFATTSLATVDRNIWSIKGDHMFSDRNRLSVLYSWQRLNGLSQSGLPGPLAHGQVSTEKPDITRVNHDFNITPALLNHVTFGLSRYQSYFSQLPAQLLNWNQELGLANVASNGSSSFPIVTFSDGFTYFGNDPKNRGSQENWTYELTDSVSYLHGRHEWKFGYEYHRGRTFQDPLDDSYAQGKFNYSTLETADPQNPSKTGYAFASFLLGDVDSGRRDFNTKGVNNLFRYHALYAQDNFKITPKLTLNLGVRYELFIPRTDTNLTLSTFDPDIPNPAANNILGALSFAGTGPGRNGKTRFGNIYKTNFGPRIGLAYRVTPKTVIRTGYGMYYSSANGNTGGGCFPCGWGTSASLSPVSSGFSPAFNWDAGFPIPAGFAMPPVIDPSYANNNSVLILSGRDGLPGRIQNWQFNIQRELPGQVLLDAAYIGSYSQHLNNWVEYNQVDPKYLSLGSLLSLPISDPRVAAAGFTKPYANFSDKATLAQALRPYPQYLAIVGNYQGEGGGTYNALQVKVEKRYSAVSLLAAYTWSKTISLNGAFTQTGSGTRPQDAYNTSVEKSLAPYDTPQVLTFIYTWDLPLGKGRKFLNNTNGFVNTVISGWTIAGVQTYRSGSLLTVTLPANTLGNGVLFTDALRPSTTGQAIRTNADRTALDPNNPNVKWLNVNAFSVPGRYQFGTAAAYLNALRNPPVFNENLSLVKRTYIREQMNLEIRADASNILNRTAFGGVNANLADPANFGRPTGVQLNPRIIQLAARFNF